MRAPYVFVSYAHEQRDAAVRIAVDLKQGRIADAWVDRVDIPAGNRYHQEIRRGVKGARLLLVLLSPEAISSDEVLAEVQYAIDVERPVIPLKVADFEDMHLPPSLRFRHYYDLRRENYAVGFAQLARLLSGAGSRTGELRAIDERSSGGAPRHAPIPPRSSFEPTHTTVKKTAESAGSLLLVLLLGGGALALVALVVIVLVLRQVARPTSPPAFNLQPGFAPAPGVQVSAETPAPPELHGSWAGACVPTLPAGAMNSVLTIGEGDFDLAETYFNLAGCGDPSVTVHRRWRVMTVTPQGNGAYGIVTRFEAAQAVPHTRAANLNAVALFGFRDWTDGVGKDVTGRASLEQPGLVYATELFLEGRTLTMLAGPTGNARLRFARAG